MTAHNPRTWEDQPSVVERDTTTLATFTLGDIRVEVRHHDSLTEGELYYVTAGNLFGSETVEVSDDARTVLILLGMLGRRGKKPMILPARCTLLAVV